ncbi:uncharacterized protein LOC144432779 [Glandiceps talaboti]
MEFVRNVLIVQFLVTMVACLDKGTEMVGVNCDQKVVTRSRANGDWFRADGSCCIEAIAVRKDKTLLGVGDDKMLYTKTAPNLGKWEGPIENSCCVRDVAVMPNGIILATTTDEVMVKRNELEDEWVKTHNGKGVRAIAAFSDGAVLGLAKSGGLKYRESIDEGNWKYLGDGGNRDVRDIAIQADDTVVGIGKSKKGLYFLDDEYKWGDLLENSDCVMSIVSTGQLVE